VGEVGGRAMYPAKVLVLNQTYEPLRFCAARRAITMVVMGKAESVEVSEQLVRSPSCAYRLPLVIRLHRYVRRPYSVGVAFSKRNVLKRDRYTCQYCGAERVSLTIDHVAPRSRGGETCWENVVTACQRCNLRKGDKTLSEAGMSLLARPRKPNVMFYLNLAQFTSATFQVEWNKYLPLELRFAEPRAERAVTAPV